MIRNITQHGIVLLVETLDLMWHMKQSISFTSIWDRWLFCYLRVDEKNIYIYLIFTWFILFLFILIISLFFICLTRYWLILDILHSYYFQDILKFIWCFIFRSQYFLLIQFILYYIIVVTIWYLLSYFNI